MNISIQSTYYPAQPPKDFNEWIRHICGMREQMRSVRYNEHALEARADALARSLGVRDWGKGLEQRTN